MTNRRKIPAGPVAPLSAAGLTEAQVAFACVRHALDGNRDGQAAILETATREQLIGAVGSFVTMLTDYAVVPRRLLAGAARASLRHAETPRQP